MSLTAVEKKAFDESTKPPEERGKTTTGLMHLKESPEPPFEPLGDRILYQRDADAEETTSGLVKPDVAKVKALKGMVLAIGSGVKTLAVGDRITFGVFAGADLPEEAFPGWERLGIGREEEMWGKLPREVVG